MLVAALMASTALVTLLPAGALAVDLFVDGQTITINSPQTFDNVLVGYNAPGQLDTVTGGTLTISGDFAVGGYNSAADGTATISGGGTVTSNRLFVGFDSAATTASGTLTISGSGSSLTVASYGYMGQNVQGSSTMTVSDGATATFGNDFSVANSVGSRSTVTVSGSGSTFTTPRVLKVGDSGAGTFSINNGGAVSAFSVYIGRNVGSSGTVTVSGSGSTLTANPGGMIVGLGGNGTLTVSDGGQVFSNNGVQIGDDAGSQGTVTVSGSGSTLTTTSVLVGIYGAGTLNVTNAGEVIASGNLAVASYDTGPGTVTVSGAGSKLTAAGNVFLGSYGAGTLVIANGGVVESGNGVLLGVQTGAQGTMTVSGSGSTFTANGSLFVGNSGTGALTVSDGGAVSTSGVLTIGRFAGAQGTVTVSGSGSRFTTTGSINVGDGGSGTLTVSSGGVVDAGDDLAAANSSGTTGTITVTGAGSKLTVASNVLLGNGGASGALNITNGGELAAAGNVSIGSVSVGTATVSGSGSKLAAGGNLYVGSGGGSGAGALTVSNGGVVQASGTIHIAQSLTSTGVLNIGAATGDTAVAAGSIQGAGGGVASIVFGAGTGLMFFNHTGTNYVFNATVSGSGSIGHVAGYTSLTGDFTGFTGSAFISGGTLAINNMFGGGVIVLSGGTLTGTGTTGIIDLQSGSIYQVNPTASSFLSSTSTVSISNGSKVKLSGGNGSPTIGSPITILTGTNITGAFGSIDTSYLFLNASLSYTATEVNLTLSRNAINFAAYAQTANQAAVANVVNQLGSNNAIYKAIESATNASQLPGFFDQLSGEAYASFQNVLIQGTGTVRDIVGQQIGNAFVAPEQGGGSALGYADDARARSQAKQTDAFRAFASAPKPAGYRAWAQAYGTSGRTSGNDNAAGTSRSGGGVYFGIDTGAGTDWRAGGFGGYGYTSTNVSGRNSSADADSYTAGAYAGMLKGPVSLQFGTSLTWNAIHSKRDVAFIGFTDHLTADYGATTLQGFTELGYSFAVQKNMTLQPFTGAALVYQRTNAFTEQGGAAALSASASSQTLGVTSVGLRTAYALGQLEGGTPVSLTGSVTWRHTFGNVTPETTMTFASGSSGFNVSGVPLTRDAALVGAGVAVGLGESTDLTLAYTGAFAAGTQDNTFNARLSARF